MDIPEQWAQTYFDLMPIHEKLRGRDFPTTRNYLRVTMCNIHDEFSERLDVPAVMSALSGVRPHSPAEPPLCTTFAAMAYGATKWSVSCCGAAKSARRRRATISWSPPIVS